MQYLIFKDKMHCIFVDMCKGTRINRRVILEIITPNDMNVQKAVHDGLSNRTWEAVPVLNNHTP